MRWFWLMIALLAVLTGVLYTVRVRAERAQQVAMQELAESSKPNTAARRSRDRNRATQPPAPQGQAAEPAPEPAVIDETPEPAAIDDPPADPIEPETTVEPIETVAEEPASPQDTADTGFNPGALITLFNESADQALAEEHKDTQTESRPSEMPSERAVENGGAEAAETERFDEALAHAAEQVGQDTDPATEQRTEQPTEPQQPEADDAPSYELGADGGFRVIDANAWVHGAGTDAQPYVLGWDVLKSVANTYEPRKGKDEIPDWLELLDGKVVQIEGHSLVPVVASTTRELLIMQNPWDGCCLGVPPTPYDAIEVVLDHDVDFGNSAIGYGSVRGFFYLDPYIVDGWVLGLFVIEEARYRSGEGVVFPEF